MAAAVSSMENGIRLGSRASPQQQQQPQQPQQQRHSTVRRSATGPRMSSRAIQVASSRPSASAAPPRATSAFSSSLMPSAASLLPSAARVAASGSSSSSVSSVRTRSSNSSSSTSSGSGSSTSGGGGFWASIMSLGSAAIPASLATGARTRTRSASSLSPSSSAALSRSGRGGPAGGVERFRPASPASGERTASAAGTGEAAAAAVEGAGAATASGSCGGGSKAVPAQKQVYLEGGIAVYTCSMCRAHLATRDHVVSECFHGHGGRAFLFERCVNVAAGRPEDRMLLTGMHVVADISCKLCGADLGWKYEEAADKSQKYKEGKFILEKCAVTLEGRSGDGYCGAASASASASSSSASSGSLGRYGAGSRPDRCGGSSSIIGWGADNAPFADGGRW